jgi:uncharacterized membrane protein HdeD (DUF308 family)
MEKTNVKLEELLKMPMEILQRHTKMLKWEGIFLILLGIAAIVMPLMFSVAIEFILGVLFIIAGLAGLERSFRAKDIPGTIFSIIMYLIFVVAGIMLIIHPMLGVMTIAAILGFFFFITGFFKMAFAFNIKPAKNWAWSLFDGIISIVLGGIIFTQWPSSAGWVVGLLAGIRLIFLGNAMIMISSGLQSSAGNAK